MRRLLFALAFGAVLVAVTTANEAVPVQLLEVTAVYDGSAYAVLIEASEPASYATHQPDARTVVVELRNVVAAGAVSQVPPGGLVSAVVIEDSVGIDSDAIALVRLSLVRPASYRVRSRRGTIRLDFDVPAGPVPATPLEPAPAPDATLETETPPASQLRAIETLVDQRGLVVRLVGDGALLPSSIHEAEQWPPRLVIDLPNVRAAVAPTLPVDIGPLRQIRVAAHSHDPLVTRVVLDLDEPLSYRIEGGMAGATDLRIVIPLDGGVPLPPIEPVGQVAEAHTLVSAPIAVAKAPPTPDPFNGANIVLDPMAALRTVDVNVDAVAEPSIDPALGGLLAELSAELSTDLGGELSAELSLVPGVELPWQVTEAPAEEPAPLVLTDDITLVEQVAALGVPLAFTPPPAAALELAEPVALVEPSAAATLAPAPAAAPLPQTPAANPPAIGGSVPMHFPAATRMSRIIRISGRPPAATASGQLAGQIVGGGRQFTGSPVSMDFQNADLRAVLRTFAEISGLNLVIDPQVEGSVDVALREVPWDQALDIILRANQLGYTVDGTVVRIAPFTTLADEESQRRKLAEEQALSGELIVLTRTLSYARAADMATLVTQAVLSQRGQVQTDARTNTMIITDLQERLVAAEQLLDTLDRPEPQVEIEARIVQARQNFARSLGVQWGVTGRVAPDIGNTTPLSFPNRGGVSGRIGNSDGAAQGPEADGVDGRALGTENAGTAVNLPATNANSAIGITLGAVDGSLNLDVIISAAENEGVLKVLSNPRVTTQNNIQAEIIQGDQIPIQTVANNTVTVTFKDAALRLAVTPQITAADTVIMQIEIDNDFADFSREVNGVPPIVTQRAATTVQVANGETTVIGGIFESQRQTSRSSVPGLSRIPLLGWLFKNELTLDDTDELLIFLTPYIVR